MDDTDICHLGTPLEPYKEDEVPSKKPITVADQIAVDSNGRRRFHGAFTGGFSAGYYNTVGSKDGWKPQTFKSSRGEKASLAEQTPMDYMDEEDTGVFGIAPQYVQTTDDFTPNSNEKLGGQKRKHQSVNQGPIPGVPILHLLLDSCHDRVPISLLKRMGWRESTSRVSRQRKRARREESAGGDEQDHENDNTEIEAPKISTCDLGPIKRQISSDDEDSDDSDEEYDLNFEMDEFESHFVGMKNDRFGIDYVGLDRNALGSSSGQQIRQGFSLFPTFEMVDQNQKKINIRGQAFGVGAFEDDDDDIYARGDMAQYDFTLSSAPKDVKKPAIKDVKKGSLEGFHTVQNKANAVKELFRINLPNGFEPRNWLKRKSRFSPMAAQVSKENEGQKVGRHDMTPEARGLILCDAPKTFQPPEISYNNLANEPKPEPPLITMVQDSTSSNPILKEANKIDDSKIAHIPFISDRFVSSNTSEKSEKTTTTTPTTTTLTEPVVIAKEVKVIRTKIIWKPCEMLAYKMNVETIGGAKPDNSTKNFSLFSCLTEGDGGRKKKPLQFTTTGELFTDEADALEKLRQDEISSKPAVPNKQENTKAVPVTNIPSTSAQILFTGNIVKNTPPAALARPNPKTELEIDIIKRQNDHPSKKKDIFKAVFDSSSEDESNDVALQNEQSNKAEAMSTILADLEEGEKLKATKVTATLINLTQTAEQLNILRNNSPPRGVFAALKIPPKVPSKIIIAASPKETNDAANNSDVYGPSLPGLPNLPQSQLKLTQPTSLADKIIFTPKIKPKPKVEDSSSSGSSEEDEWIEKSHKTRKAAKKDKKNKKDKKKHKKKKKVKKEKKKGK